MLTRVKYSKAKEVDVKFAYEYDRNGRNYVGQPVLNGKPSASFETLRTTMIQLQLARDDRQVLSIASL